MKDTQKVATKSIELEKSKISKQSQRNHLTSFIGHVLKSRQEKTPLVSNYIDRAKGEPLHLKNVANEMFIKLLEVCISQSTKKCQKMYYM